MTGRYAAKTEVSTDRSKQEIEQILQRYGADQFMYGWTADSAVVGFRMHQRQIRFILPLPDRKAVEFTQYRRGSSVYRRAESESQRLWEQACRQRWRALALAIKAKLECVEIGISSFESEFLANIVLPDGQTVGQWATPQIEQVYLTGQMPPLLLAAGGAA